MNPEYPIESVFFSATVQYFVVYRKGLMPKGSISAASFWFFKSLVSTCEIPYPTRSPRLPRNETTVLRVNTAMAKMTAAMNSVLGTAKTRIAFQCAAHTTGPKRSASTQGMYFAARIPAETPSRGITATSAEPRNLPAR